MLDEIEELTQRLSEEQENKRKMGDKLSHERHQFQRDKEATQEVSWAICLLPVYVCCRLVFGGMSCHSGQGHWN